MRLSRQANVTECQDELSLEDYLAVRNRRRRFQGLGRELEKNGQNDD